MGVGDRAWEMVVRVKRQRNDMSAWSPMATGIRIPVVVYSFWGGYNIL